MASIYQKSIQSLSIHLQNSRVHDLVSRAIKRLEAQEAEARELKHLGNIKNIFVNFLIFHV